MVGTNRTPEESGGMLAQRQAEGLRALATLIEQNPALADKLSYALNMLAPLVNHEPDPRVTLTAFHAAAVTHGTEVSVINEPHGCIVAAKFGPVVVRMHARADLMAGGRTRYPHYEPLVIDDADGGAR
ncbi:hypothetical protein [Amycolatopsis granulosa]|uniref:hypothetical protein n=1 Tax=Amycolatopsis granulosa TaxID=185684 RepID=UPI001422D857|nr:hypothetical protein [Amycolatopsis granulosa]NIH85769.1 hypothetical protein [Amycolatopsis granulosa]